MIAHTPPALIGQDKGPLVDPQVDAGNLHDRRPYHRKRPPTGLNHTRGGDQAARSGFRRRRRLNSILRLGLLCSYSKGKLASVWACSPARSWWAVLHVIK